MKHLPDFVGADREMYSPSFTGLLLANLFFWMSVNFFLPVLPLYYHSLGFNDHEVGLAIGFFSLGAVLFRVLAGKAVDHYGSKPVISAGIILSTGAIISYWFANSLFEASLSRFLHGAGISGFSAAALTMATLMQEEKNATEAVAVYTLFTMVGVGIAASSAGWLYQSGDFPAVLAAGAIATVLSLLLFPKAPPLKIKTTTGQALPLARVAGHPGVFVPTVSLLAVNLCYAAVMTFLPLLMVNRGIHAFSLFYIAYSLAVIFARVWVGKLCLLLKPGRLAFYVLLIMSASMFITGLSGSWWVLASAGACIGIGYGLAFPTMATMITASVQPANRGTAFGFFTMAVDGGFAIGAIGMGFIAGEFGYEAVFTAAGIYTALYSILYNWWLAPKVKPAAS